MGQEAAGNSDVRQVVERYLVRSSLLVHASPERAYDVFVGALADWWVREYTWSGPEALKDIGIEPRAGGMLYEIGPYGFRTDWGRVLIWDPPHRLVFTWQIGPDRAPVPDPAKGSEVEVHFTAQEPHRTLVEVEHRNFDRHGKAAEGYRQALTAGWQELITRYRVALNNDLCAQ